MSLFLENHSYTPDISSDMEAALEAFPHVISLKGDSYGISARIALGDRSYNYSNATYRDINVSYEPSKEEHTNPTVSIGVIDLYEDENATLQFLNHQSFKIAEQDGEAISKDLEAALANGEVDMYCLSDAIGATRIGLAYIDTKSNPQLLTNLPVELPAQDDDFINADKLDYIQSMLLKLTTTYQI